MKVLISGGTGLVGSEIIRKLLERGDEVYNLTTRKNYPSTQKGLTHIYWNPEQGMFNSSILENVDAIINLAGFNVANRWTEQNKKKIVDSRMHSTKLLVDGCLKATHAPKIFISTGASGYYSSSFHLQDETASAGQGFLADLSEQWERVLQPLKSMPIRSVILRVGVVMDKKDGAVAKMVPFFNLGLGSATGSGKQWMSWIHLHDLANMYLFALDQPNIQGVYNAVAPAPVTNAAYSKALAHALNRPFFLPAIPEFALKLLFGEMSSMLLNSQNISSKKIQEAGFKFQYQTIDSALQQLFEKK